MDNRLIGRHIDAAILLCGGKSEHVVVFIDGASHGAERVVAVGHGVGDGEFLEPAGACRLDDSDVGDVVRDHCVEEYPHLPSFGLALPFAAGIPRGLMTTQDAVSDGVLPGLVGRYLRLVGECPAVKQISSVIDKFYHDISNFTYLRLSSGSSESMNTVRASISAAPPGEIPSSA